MRRSVHSLLVGLLVFSPSIDAARACGHLRHWRHGPNAGAITVMIVAPDDWGWCRPVEPACEVEIGGWCDMAVLTPAGDTSDCCEAMPCGATLDARVANSVVVAAPVVPAKTEALGSVVVSEPVPTLAPAPRPAEPVPSVPAPVATEAALEPVAPASAADPAGAAAAIQPEPAPVAAEPGVEERPAPPPAPRNVFEEADAALPPDLDGPAADPAPAAEPAEPRAAREPLRRWIDDTAAYAVVGRLVDVRGERVEILKADGRSVTVPLTRLSGLDRGYVAGAAARIASVRSPRPTDSVSR